MATSCDPINGFCKCDKGWEGKRCDKPCRSDKFGENCAKNCQCSPGQLCNPVDGK